MFTLVRTIIAIPIIFLIFFILHKKNIFTKKTTPLKVISFLVATELLVVILSFFPFENIFMSFKSPQSVFNYLYRNSLQVTQVVQGEKTDFVVAEKRNNRDDEYTYLILPKCNDGWKIGNGAKINIVNKSFSNNILIVVYQYEEENEFFITVFNCDGGCLTIKDSANNKFVSTEQRKEHLEKTFVTYYTCISDCYDDYSMEVEDEKGTKTTITLSGLLDDGQSMDGGLKEDQSADSSVIDTEKP